jgi:hypothetical protein
MEKKEKKIEKEEKKIGRPAIAGQRVVKHFYFPLEIAEQLKEIAYARRMSMQAVLNDLISQGYAKIK